jgi:hypothetical protein
MKLLRDILICALLAVLILAAYCGALFIRTATETTKAIPKEIADTRAQLICQVATLRVDALAEIDKQADGLRKELHGDANKVNAQVSAIRGQLDKRTGDALSRIDTAQATVDAFRTDLQPTLKNSAALVKDAQDSWDDSYDDVRNLLDSAEVTTTQAAETMQAISKVAPKVAASTEQNASNLAGITQDIHTITAAATKPKTFWGKAWAAITVASRFAGLM